MLGGEDGAAAGGGGRGGQAGAGSSTNDGSSPASTAKGGQGGYYGGQGSNGARGSSGSSNTGANGRTVIGSNARASFTDSENGSTPIATTGPTAFNPYVVGNFATPFIPDVVLGADV